MARRSGAGASVSSGASYQARIGAFAIAASICDLPVQFCSGEKIKHISFETNEEIDDINISTVDGTTIYIQAKSSIDFSTKASSDFGSVFQQFLRQFQKSGQIGSYRLIAGRTSSSRVLDGARAALQAFQSGTEELFRRDQNQSTIETLDAILALCLSLQDNLGMKQDRDIALKLLKCVSIWPFDIEDDDSNAQAVVLALGANDYISPELLWGKLISDCVSYSKRRNSVSISDIRPSLERFKLKRGAEAERRIDRFFEFTVKSQFSVGRDVLLCKIPKNNVIPEGLAILELYRFDAECNYRIKYTDKEAILGSGLHVPVIRRTSTYQRMLGLIETYPSMIEGEEGLNLLPINSEEDFEEGLCADAHRARLESARLQNDHPLHCIRCGQAVSTDASPIVELDMGEELAVGVCHFHCLGPTYRIIGEVRNAFFEQHPELENFDVRVWFEAIQDGQVTFRLAEHMGMTTGYMSWNGRRNRSLENKFVIALLLENGDRQFVTERGRVTRYTMNDATHAAAKMKESQRRATEVGNEFRVAAEARIFGSRSYLLEKFGAGEKLLAITDFEVVPYEKRYSAGEDPNAKWYAPAVFLRDRHTSEPLDFFGSTPILTNPMHLKNFIANWKEAGIEIPEYEIQILKTDEEFDGFIIWLEDRNRRAIIDPIFEPKPVMDDSVPEEFLLLNQVRGFLLGSTETLQAEFEHG